MFAQTVNPQVPGSSPGRGAKNQSLALRAFLAVPQSSAILLALLISGTAHAQTAQPIPWHSTAFLTLGNVGQWIVYEDSLGGTPNAAQNGPGGPGPSGCLYSMVTPNMMWIGCQLSWTDVEGSPQEIGFTMPEGKVAQTWSTIYCRVTDNYTVRDSYCCTGPGNPNIGVVINEFRVEGGVLTLYNKNFTPTNGARSTSVYINGLIAVR